MSKLKYTELHIVISPLEDKYKKYKEIVPDFLDKYYNQWIVSEELGENKHPHLDIVGWRKTSTVAYNETDRLKKFLGIPKDSPESKRTVKCYGIMDGELEWQVGYNRKEDGKYQTSDLFDCDLDHCKEIWSMNPNHKNERVKQMIEENQRWSVDTLVDKYIEYLEHNDITNSEKSFLKFRQENKKKIKYSVFSKIKMETLDDHLRAWFSREVEDEELNTTIGYREKY